ncbi:MAG: phosphoribosylanthranilate isomerase [Defluviitaleaceae bacterium]|nr:phosphoribosylanthranilate isomerase [Defluviitaleaceae bacterium]
MPPKIKICGITRLCDIEAINAAKPDYIGFVFAESRRRVTQYQAKALYKALEPLIIAFGVFVNAPLDYILRLVGEGIIDAIQLHGAEDEFFIEELRRHTASPIIKAVSVQKKGDVQKWENSAADFLLLDHKNGGTGETFDWDLIGAVKKPFFLAGGLSAKNVIDAIKNTNPFAVDVSSGVEVAPGVKCPEKINRFVKVCKSGRSKM